MKYRYRPDKPGWRVHITNPCTGRTYCQVENNGGKRLTVTERRPPRLVCKNCIALLPQLEQYDMVREAEACEQRGSQQILL